MNDPFDLLGIAPRFDLDLPAIELRHRELSKALHPGSLHTGAPAAERRMALSRAIDVNEAFRVVWIRSGAQRPSSGAGAAVGETSEPKPSRRS